MSEKKNLIQIYKDILSTAWMTANEKGVISRMVDPETGEKSPVMIEDNTDNKKKKTAVLPIKENLVGLDNSEFLVIHPLNENPSKPASPVVDFLRRMMSVRLNWVLSTMLPELLVFASSPAKHDLLKPEQLDILTCLADAGKDSASKFLKLLEASKAKNGHFATIVSVYLTRGGVVKEKTYHRAAIVKFTLYEELIKTRNLHFDRSEQARAERDRLKRLEKNNNSKDDKKTNSTENKIHNDIVVLGVKISKKDLEVFIRLFERVIPNIDNPQHYSTGSNANVAPFMDSMMNTFLKLFSITNDMVENYRVVFSIPDLMIVPMEWSDELMDIDSLSSIVRLVPPQRGNEGDSRVDEKLREEHSANMGNFKSTAEKDAAGNNFNRPQPTPQQPEPQKPAVNPNGTVSFNNGVATSFNQHQQQSTTFVPPWENQPVTGFGNNQAQANNGKVSFSSLAVGQKTQSSFQGFQNQGRNTPFGGSSFGGGFSGV